MTSQTSTPAIAPERLSELEEIVGSDRVLTSEPDRLAYNADCSPQGIIRARGRRLDEHQPAAIVQPAHEGDVVELVGWARRTDTALVAYGAGSGVCLGAVGDRDSVIVDLKRLDAIKSVDRDNMTVRVGAGIIGQLLEKELERRELTMGHFPSSIYCSSLGGYLAARSAGQMSSRYGKIEDMVASVRVVTGAGEVIETAPDPADERPRAELGEAGPNPTQLFVGSEGTLGLITEATLDIEPTPNHRYYRGFQFSDLESGLEGIRRMMQAGVRPSVVRLYDPNDTFFKGSSEGVSSGDGNLLEQMARVAQQRLPQGWIELIEEAVDEARDAAAGAVLGRPRLVNGFLDQVARKSFMIVGFEGTSTLVEEEADWAFEMLGRYGIDVGAEPGFSWMRHRYDTSYLQSPVFDTGLFVDTMEVSTTWDNLQNLYRAVRRALSPHVVPLAHFSHVYPEGSSIYFTFVGHAPDVDGTLELHERTWHDALEACAEAGGSITHHHGVGALKAAWSGRDHVGGEAHFEALKETFDPDGILNPGKVYD